MRTRPARIWLAALLACAAYATAAPAAQAAFGVEERNFEAGTCTVESCTYASVEGDHGRSLHPGRRASPVRHHGLRI